MEPAKSPAMVLFKDACIPDRPRPDIWLVGMEPGPEIELLPRDKPNPRPRLVAGEGPDGAWGRELGIRGPGVLKLGGEEAVEEGSKF